MGAGLSSAGLDSGPGSGFASSFLGSEAGGSLAIRVILIGNQFKDLIWTSQRGD